jgi:hypothetical protein
MQSNGRFLRASFPPRVTRILAAPAALIKTANAALNIRGPTLERLMEPESNVETIAEIIRGSPNADEAYRTMLRFVIRAGEQVLGPERADATLDELLLEENAAQAERLLQEGLAELNRVPTVGDLLPGPGPAEPVQPQGR